MRRQYKLLGGDAPAAPLVSTFASPSAPTKIPPRSIKAAAADGLAAARPTKFHLPGQEQ